MDGARNHWLIVNSASGSHSDAAVAALSEALAEAGRPPARTITLPDDQAPDRAALEAGNVGLLSIFTGDGTANAVVTGLYGWDGQILMLPGGTQNLLAKAFHGDATANEIVAALAAGQLIPCRRDIVRSSQGDALCEILAGPGAHWSDVREAMREGDVGGVATTLSQAIGQTTGGGPVRVVEPALGKEEGYPAVRLYPEGPAIAVDGYYADTLGEVAQQGLALLRRDFREGPHDELGRHAAVVCQADEPIALMIDGERRTGGPQERFTIEQCPVVFLASPGHFGPP